VVDDDQDGANEKWSLLVEEEGSDKPLDLPETGAGTDSSKDEGTRKGKSPGRKKDPRRLTLKTWRAGP